MTLGGVIIIELSSISSICMTYTPFSYDSGSKYLTLSTGALGWYVYMGFIFRVAPDVHSKCIRRRYKQCAQCKDSGYRKTFDDFVRMKAELQIYLHKCRTRRGAPLSPDLAIACLVVPHTFRLCAVAPDSSYNSIPPPSNIAHRQHSRGRGRDRWVWLSTPIKKAKHCVVFRGLVRSATIRITSITTDSVQPLG